METEAINWATMFNGVEAKAAAIITALAAVAIGVKVGKGGLIMAVNLLGRVFR